MSVKVSRPPALPPMATSAERNFHQAMWNAVNWLLDNHPDLMQPVAQTAPVKASTFSAPPAQLGATLLDADGNVITQFTGDMIAPGSIDSTHLTDGAVKSSAIDQQAITQDHIAVDAVNAQHVQQETLSNDHIVADQSTVASAGVVANGSTGALQIDLSLSATDGGSGNETVINNDTANAVDGAALGQTADATQTTNLPATVAAAIGLGMLTDAQTALPTTSGLRWTFFSDNGGPVYAGPEYDTNLNFGGDSSAIVTTTNVTSNVTISNAVRIPNPGQAVNILAEADCVVSDNSATVTSPRIWIEYSLDGGITWTTGPLFSSTFTALNGSVCSLHASLILFGVTSTADILFRARGAQTVATSITFNMKNLIVKLEPVSNFFLIAPLSASIPSTASMSCTSTYPVASCTATKQLTVTVNGVGPFTFSWVKVSGTGTITSGSTAQIATVSDTETTTTGGATHNTVVNCTVTDTGQSYSTTAGSVTANVATLTIGPHSIAVGNVVPISGCTPAAYNNAAATITAVGATTISYALVGTPGVITVQGTVGNPKVTTANGTVAGTFTLVYPPISVSISATGGVCRVLPPPDGTGVCTSTASFTTNASGGDGSFSYSNVAVSGAGTITSGASSKNWTASTTGTAPYSVSGTFKSTVTDGHSHTNNASKTVTFTGSLI